MAKRRARSAQGGASGREGQPGSATKDDSPPPRSKSILNAPGGSLLVLRAFLGVTFSFAGLQKLTNRGFFNAATPGSFQQQLRGSIATSPLHHLLSPALHAPTLVALFISFGELAVGLGTLLGLYGRIAATGGMLLSLSFFLTVSFNDNPYYYGPDIVFLFAWTPFILAGSGAWSLDAIFARRAERAHRAVLAAAQGGPGARHRAAELERRAFLQKASAAGVIGMAALVAGGVMAAIGRIAGGSQSSVRSGALGGGDAPTLPSTTTSSGESHGASTTTSSSVASSGASPKGVRIGPASDVPVGGAASFTDPKEGVPALVVQIKRGVFRAFSAVCPHAGCQVQFDQQSDLFVCPCHGSIFNGSTGAVQQGPASTGLSSIPIALGSNGQLYVDD
jgi:thiosulfate dehydrogenase [quinone] large subunit